MINIDELDKDKLYYSIGEVSAMFDVNSSLIRFWEKEFDQLHPKKNKKGKRLFSKSDIELINQIYFLVKDKGYTLSGARDIIKRKGKTEENEDDIHYRLLEIKEKLIALRKQL